MRKNIAIREFFRCARLNANNLAASGDALVHLNLRAQFIRERRLRNSLLCPEISARSWQRLHFN
jgi:hypothetical protein